MHRFILFPFVLLLFLCCPAIHSFADPITTGTLIREMIGLKRLIEFPSPAYKTIQFSSYDHRSDHPGGPNWFANSDGFGNEPVPNFEKVLQQPGEDGIGEYLICNVNGPGAMVRTWTAAIKGTIRLYLDGTQEPVYDGPAQEFLFNPYKVFADQIGLTLYNLKGTFRQRNAGYCPIPFEKRCRIVWRGNLKDIHFYQIQFRLYGPGAQVKTFQPKDLRTYRGEIREVSKVLSNPSEEWTFSGKLSAAPVAVSVQPGEQKEVLTMEGPKAFESLTLKVHANDLQKALRQTILHIHFDEYPWGQVQSPIGDFFGAAPGINPYDSVPFTVKPDGTMLCRFIMPFEKSARIVIENQGEQPVAVTGHARPMEYNWRKNVSMHFRARWRVDHDLVASNSDVQDLPYLIANGKGVFVGSAAMLLNPNPIPTSYGNWWGEGDEKIFVDDDYRPSTFGTGSEDYYNYAWSSPDIFIFPYCGQPRNDGPGNRGFVTNNRWHILDPLPFQMRIAFYMELFSHVRTPDFSYARIGYHYAQPGIIDDHFPITEEDVRALELPKNWTPEASMGAKNSFFYQAEEMIQGNPTLTYLEDNLWSGGRAMVWHPKLSGDELTLSIPVNEDGKYKIRFGAVKNNKSGTFSMELDDETLLFENGEKITDLNIPYRTLLRAISSKDVELNKRAHRLTLKYEGPSPDGNGKTLGIDFLWIQKR